MEGSLIVLRKELFTVELMVFEELIPFTLSVTCVKVDFLVCFQGHPRPLINISVAAG